MPDHNQHSPTPHRFNRQEIGGALGDLGTFIPLLTGMVHQCGLQLSPALFCAGLMNVLSGVLFRIPMPVQPMKAIATVALTTTGFNETNILCAGILTGAVILGLALSGLISRLNSTIPKSVVRGIQLALGLKLLIHGIGMISQTQTWISFDSIGLGLLCTLLVLLFYFSTRVPGALVVFIIGLMALLAADPALLSKTSLGFTWYLPDLTNWQAWKEGFKLGAIPQIPLTTLNSVIAVCALSADLFPNRAAEPRRVAVSVALMNLITCPLGAMPMCHGSGGLAAQYRFGARTGGSVIMLGIAKMVLALLFGSSLLMWLQGYPLSVLGVLLAFSGLELAMVCRDQRTRPDYFVMLITAGVCLSINTAAGFLIGWIFSALLLWGVFRLDPPQDNLRS